MKIKFIKRTISSIVSWCSDRTCSLAEQVKCNTGEERGELLVQLLVELPVEVLGDELQLVPGEEMFQFQARMSGKQGYDRSCVVSEGILLDEVHLRELGHLVGRPEVLVAS